MIFVAKEKNIYIRSLHGFDFRAGSPNYKIYKNRLWAQKQVLKFASQQIENLKNLE